MKKRFTWSLAVMLAFIAVFGLSVAGCGSFTASSEKVLDGAVYAEHPGSRILGTVKAQSGYRSAKVICTEDSKVRLIMVYDSTHGGTDSANIDSGQDFEIAGIACGQELKDLRREAETGRFLTGVNIVNKPTEKAPPKKEPAK